MLVRKVEKGNEGKKEQVHEELVVRKGVDEGAGQVQMCLSRLRGQHALKKGTGVNNTCTSL